MEEESVSKTTQIIVVIVIIILIIAGFIYYQYYYLPGEDDGGGGGGGPGTGDNIPPIAVIATNATDDTRVGDLIEFNATESSDEDGNIILYDWDFGDGITRGGSEFEVTNHSYTNPGQKTINLTVRDDQGGIGYDTLIILVRQSDYHTEDSAILSAQAVVPIEWPSNYTFTFEVDKNAIRANFSLTFTGWSSDSDDGFYSSIEIFIYDPIFNLIENRSVQVRGQNVQAIEYLAYQLTFSGTYQIDVICNSGTVNVAFEADVYY